MAGCNQVLLTVAVPFSTTPNDYAEAAVYFGVSFFAVTWPYLFEVNNQVGCRGA
jgi:hypothetical protein